jgi:hypothetical protein
MRFYTTVTSCYSTIAIGFYSISVTVFNCITSTGYYCNCVVLRLSACVSVLLQPACYCVNLRCFTVLLPTGVTVLSPCVNVLLSLGVTVVLPTCVTVVLPPCYCSTATVCYCSTATVCYSTFTDVTVLLSPSVKYRH